VWVTIGELVSSCFSAQRQFIFAVKNHLTMVPSFLMILFELVCYKGQSHYTMSCLSWLFPCTHL
jgi:hypothetical protein